VIRLDKTGEYGLLTRDQSWATNVILFDKTGQEVRNYPGGFMNGVDDPTGEPGEDGKSTAEVGFNGDGGLVLANTQGKRLWQKAESNVWHVETLDIKRDGHREMLHTNARGELVVRSASGEVVAQSHISGGPWRTLPGPQHDVWRICGQAANRMCRFSLVYSP